ncbi:PglY protein [Kitasatospora humi]|uniref:PglY protein n=1 Tax=Kitasatospora humi TaxID=2893891 RepID=UPI0024C0139A|nr:PglY protein [Kitasatospora humi]
MPTSELFLRDVFDIKEDVHAGDFKIELSQGFSETDARVAEYVVTEQLETAFTKALGIVAAAVRTGNSHAAYLHGSFGAGKSHFLTVLHAVLEGHPGAWAKDRLQGVVAQHRDWLQRSRFLMVPYHLVGSTDLDSALLGGYVQTVRALHPDKPTPAVYRADSALADAQRQREFLADDGKFLQWLGTGAAALTPGAAATSTGPDAEDDDLDASLLTSAETGGAPGAAVPAATDWTSADLDRAFAAPAGDPRREALVSALLTGPMAAYAQGARGVQGAFLPLENGLSVISRHAESLGYHGIVLYLDELILWLQAHMGDQDFVRTQVQQMVKLIESGDSNRPVPIISFVSRQRDLSQLVGSDVAGADVQNLEQQVEYLAERFDVIELEDSNLVEIIKHRVLSPKPGMEGERDEAFRRVESARDGVRQVLLDAHGRTEADWDDFRTLYPLSPALLNVLVDLSGALQRERTGLKLVQELLRRRRDDLRMGDLIPIGDLWDVIAVRSTEAFTGRLRKDAETANRFHARVRNFLLQKYGSAEDPRFQADERLVKTLLLAALAPNVPALTRLTGDRLAALNHGSIRTKVGSAGSVAVKRLQELQPDFGELRSDGTSDPVFHLHLSDLDVEPLLDEVRGEDNMGRRRQWVKDQLWSALGINDAQPFVCERQVVWRGTRRTAEFVFGNVRDPHLPDDQFEPQTKGNVRFVLDYPFDENHLPPSDDVRRIEELKRKGRTAQTIVWLPDFLSEQRANQLGRLLRMNYLLERNRLDDHTATRPADERVQIRQQLKEQAGILTTQLTSVLHQLYGINAPDPSNIGAEVPDGQHLWSLEPSFPNPQPEPGIGFEQNLLRLTDGLYDALYPKHPDFDPKLERKAITPKDLRTALEWIGRATANGTRREVVDRHHLETVRRVVHALQLGEVHDGPLNLTNDWRIRINQKAAEAKAGPDIAVDDIHRWIEELGYTGLDRLVRNLLIATYALLDDRTWLFQTSPLDQAPDLERIGAGYGLRAVSLPTEDEFATARIRAGHVFGISVTPALFARNVAKLASAVHKAAQERKEAVGGLRTTLQKHAADLGLTGPDAPRLRSTRAAADLIARLTRTTDATTLVRELASAAYDVTDQEIGAAISHAPDVLDALDQTRWNLVQSARGFAGRPDGIGDRAERLITGLHKTAAAHEQADPLAPVLSQFPDRALALVDEVARLAQATPPAPQPVVAPPAAPGADDISLTDHGDPSVPSGAPTDPGSEQPAAPAATPTAPAAPAPSRWDLPGTSRLEDELAVAVSGMSEEIRAYLTRHPGSRVQISWHPVSDAPDGASGTESGAS